MIGPFQGPEVQSVPHARLLYARHFQPESLWNDWPTLLKSLDDVISEHPRLELANSGLYLYFFGSEAKEAWLGREIVGHLSKAPEGFGTFDSFKTEVFSWSLPKEQMVKIKGPEVLESAEKLRALAGSELASTWRAALSPLEPWTQEGDVHKDLPAATFQFYKKD